MTKKQTRKQPGRFTVQFKDKAFHDRLVSVAKSRGMCVATLIRAYTMDGVAIDERTYPRCINKST